MDIREVDTLDIREVDVFDEDQFHRSYEVMRAADVFERPEATPWQEQEVRVEFRSPDQAERKAVFSAYDGDAAVGTAVLFFPLLDNTDMTWLGVYVDPAQRRRGVGSALLERLVEETRRAGRKTMLAEAMLPFERREDHPYRRFAEHHGFALASVEIRRRLRLPVDDALIQGWLDEAAPYHADYRIETFADPVPDELLPSVCHVSNQLAVDAPSGDIEFEEEALTPEVWREQDRTLQAMGRVRLITVALDGSGQAVALSTLSVPELDRPNAYQWATLVLRGHRGHRLGLAVKATNLRELQKRFPGYERIWTTNNETNAHMVSINERLGFERVELSAHFQRKL
ncbi:MAG TPA: GNAT family N-acetyltransferase [Nocardioidaceae bacterium]|nr:GNAT family N-acetyltransferase [Nocardioidaceae bacterium]